MRRKRTGMGLLQRELATQLAVDKTTVSHWETNETVPGIHLWPKIIGFLGYDPTESGDELPERLQAYRRVHGLSQVKLAGILGVSECSVRGWEAGKHAPVTRLRARIETLF